MAFASLNPYKNKAHFPIRGKETDFINILNKGGHKYVS
jgi:hypothetical protein